MGYKKYSNEDSAWEIIQQIKDERLTGNTAYRELVQIRDEWSGTSLSEEAEFLIDTMFSEYKFRK